MAHINKRYWGRNTHITTTKPSFREYVNMAAIWAKNNRKAACKKCGSTNECTCAAIIGGDVVAAFPCNCGHTTKQKATEAELLRAYNLA